MHLKSAMIAAALAAFATGAASAAPRGLSDFRLPTDPPAPQPDRQGPVADDVPESRAQPQQQPPATPPPAVQAQPPLVNVPPVPEPTSPAEARPGATRASPQPVSAAAPAVASPVPARPAPAGTDSPIPALPPAAAPRVAPDADAALADASVQEPGGSGWLWAVLALILAGAAGGAIWWRRRGQVAGVPLAVPVIERPRLDRTATPGAPAIAASEPLQVSLEPVRLSLTLMNAALVWRLEIINLGAAALRDLTIGADMISAHASLRPEEQLAGPAPATAAVQRIDRLEPGEHRIVEGELRLPFPEIVPIRQGDAALLLPLARFRVEAEGAAPVTRAFVIGQPAAQPGAGLQPFRLDLGPRVFPRLEQRAFA